MNVSKLEKMVVNEYYQNKEEFYNKTYEIIIKYTKIFYIKFNK